MGLTLVAASGAIGFFVYSQARWGRWDIYMLTQAAGWGIIPDYFAVFKPESYRWLVPALNNPTEASQVSMSVGSLLLLSIAACELLPSIRRRAGLPVRAGIYFCAAAIYYVSVSGVACLAMESMLRYELCVHALIVLAFLNFLRQFRLPPPLLRVFGMAAAVLVSALGLSVQGWYVWNFTRGNWVACTNENECSDHRCGTGWIDGGVSSFQEQRARHRARGRPGLCRRHFQDGDLQGFPLRYRRAPVL